MVVAFACEHLARQRQVVARGGKVGGVGRQRVAGKGEVGEVPLGCGPVERNRVARPFREAIAICDRRRIQHRRIARDRPQPAKSKADVVLRRGPVHRCGVGQVDGQGGAVCGDGLLKQVGVSGVFAQCF
jgi:hypothetical protein